MTHADGHFAIGKTHTVCQDYVRCGKTVEGKSYVIVSDGCSSSPDTDIGARLLVLAAETTIRSSSDQINFNQIINIARDDQSRMGLVPNVLDATLLIAIETEHTILVWAMGDGVLAAKKHDGTIEYARINFTMGAPFYPNYLSDIQRWKAYTGIKDNQMVVARGLLDGTETEQAQPTANYDYNSFFAVFPKREYALVVLMTDGAMSFRKGFEAVSPNEVVRQIVDVKVPTGEFMVRRAKRFLGKHCQDQSWHHDDDFGVGAISIDPPKE